MLQQAQTKLNNLSPQKRVKRGLINAVGTVNKWLFGTMNDDDRQNIQDNLNILNKNQVTLKDQLNLKTSLINTLYDKLNNTFDMIKNNQIQINKRITTIQSLLASVVKDSNIFLGLQAIINNCQILIEFMDNINVAIGFAHLNIVHQSLLNYNDLQGIKNTLSQLYMGNQIIQFSNQQSYYQLLGIEVNFLNNKIIFSIYVPIVMQRSFSSFHIYAIPIKNLTLVPPKPILILGTSTHMMRNEACPRIEDIFICPNELSPNKESCLPNILHGRNSTDCKHIHVYFQEPLIEQISRDHVLIFTPDVLTVHKTCTGDGVLKIYQSTLITIPEGCSIKIDDEVFTPNTNYINGSKFQLPDIVPYTSQPIHMQPLQLQTVQLAELPQIYNHAILLDQADDQSRTSLWTILSISGLVLCLTLIIFTWYKKQIYGLLSKFQKPRGLTPRGSTPSPAETSTSRLPF